MTKVTAKLLFFAILTIALTKPVTAYNPYATGSAVVSATILSTTFNAPVLISPANNSTTTNNREPLVWKRPEPLPATPIHHYDVYLDGTIFANSISDSITTQTYYFYTIRRDENTFYLEFNTNLAEGYHTWSVTAYNTFGTSAATDTWTFYVDSTTPFINLQKVDNQTLNWNTAQPDSIPDINLRDLTVTTPDPLLTGTVEPFANMQIVLMCPQNILNCQNQTWQGNYPDGNWQHRFYGLIKGHVYTVYMSATDAAGNSIIFPEYYLTYGVVTPTPSATITKIPTPTPETPGITLTPTITLEPTPEIVIPPTPFIPVPPVAPTPPIFQNATPSKTPGNFGSYSLFLLVLGLPLHLFMAGFGYKIELTNSFSFLYTLLFPFLGNKPFQTVTFASLYFYDPNKLDSPWQKKVADIKGFYSLKTPLIKNLFIKITSTGRTWKNIIFPSTLLSTNCLFPKLQDTYDGLERLRKHSTTLRSLPLALACITSAYALYISPNYFYLSYLFISLLLVFSEYTYPHTTRD